MSEKKVILVIMDGWGLGKVKSVRCHSKCQYTLCYFFIFKYPNTTLTTCGEAVGLPEGQMGNSEVGHLNFGAGRIVYQELQRINVAIRDGEFQKIKHFLNQSAMPKQNNKAFAFAWDW